MQKTVLWRLCSHPDKIMLSQKGSELSTSSSWFLSNGRKLRYVGVYKHERWCLWLCNDRKLNTFAFERKAKSLQDITARDESDKASEQVTKQRCDSGTRGMKHSNCAEVGVPGALSLFEETESSYLNHNQAQQQWARHQAWLKTARAQPGNDL